MSEPDERTHIRARSSEAMEEACLSVFGPGMPERYRTVMGTLLGTSDMVIWLDRRGRFVFANPAACERLGYTPGEMAGISVVDINPFIDSNDDFTNNYYNRFESRSRRTYQMRHRTKRGEEYPVEICSHLVGDDEVEFIFSNIRDVSVRDRNAAELNSLSKFRGDILDVLGSIQGHWYLRVETGELQLASGIRQLLKYEDEDELCTSGGVDDLAALIDRRDRGEFLTWIRRATREATVIEGDTRMIRRTGKLVWVRHRIGVSRNSKDGVTTLVGTVHNINRSRRVEAERNNLFDALVERYVVGDFSTGTWTRISDGWKGVVDDAADMPLMDLFAKSDRPRAAETLHQLLERGKPVETSLMIQTDRGDVATHWNFIRHHDDDPTFFGIVRKDADARRQTLAAIADAVPSTLYVFDLAKQRNVFANRSIGESLGYSPEEIREMGDSLLHVIIHPEDFEIVSEHHKTISMTSGSEIHEAEYRVRHKDGRYRLVHSSDRVFERDADGTARSIVGTATPLDDLETLKRYSQQLEQVNHELEQFVYVASHDLRQPLRGISNLAGFLEEDCVGILPDDSVEHLNAIRGRIVRMENLLGDLLEFSRAGRKSGDVEPFSLDEMVDDAIELLGAEPGYTIEKQGEFPFVTTHRVALTQIVRNLIGNAYKHRADNLGRTIVRSEVQDDHLCMQIEDDGPGIEPKFRKRVFKMFQTLKARDEVEGSGMGLALCEKLASMHRGDVSIDDFGPPGCRFIVRWPVFNSAESATKLRMSQVKFDERDR